MKQKIVRSKVLKPAAFFGKVACFILIIYLLSSSINNAVAGNIKTETKAIIKLSGTVTDEDNRPIAGVAVEVKDSKKGTLTDTNGHFSLDVNEGTVLLISHAGFIQQEVTVNQPELAIKLKEDVKQLEEVSIGYQRMRKSDLTGAISSVRANELNLTTPTISQALVGKVAGVQVSQVSGAPYSGTKIRVRGTGSVNASSEPLYVIDNYAVGGNINSGPGNGGAGTSGYNPATAGNDIFVNPDDIESITILKDAASAAIFGSRASGGEVLITTKRGKTGKGKFEYDYQVGVNQLAHKVKLMNAAEFAQVFIDGRNNNYKDVLIARGVTWSSGAAQQKQCTLF